jgi:phosphohistidine phosphatase
MRLYLFRHAEASYDAPDDFYRVLTEQGRRRTQRATQAMKQLGVAPRQVISSPRLRARQTAEIVAEGLEVPLEVREELDIGFNVHVAEALARQTFPDDVLLVGHNPSFEDVVTAITGANVRVKKGSLIRIDFEGISSPLRGELTWLIAPKVFDALTGKQG